MPISDQLPSSPNIPRSLSARNINFSEFQAHYRLENGQLLKNTTAKGGISKFAKNVVGVVQEQRKLRGKTKKGGYPGSKRLPGNSYTQREHSPPRSSQHYENLSPIELDMPDLLQLQLPGLLESLPFNNTIGDTELIFRSSFAPSWAMSNLRLESPPITIQDTHPLQSLQSSSVLLTQNSSVQSKSNPFSLNPEREMLFSDIQAPQRSEESSKQKSGKLCRCCLENCGTQNESVSSLVGKPSQITLPPPPPKRRATLEKVPTSLSSHDIDPSSENINSFSY